MVSRTTRVTLAAFSVAAGVAVIGAGLLIALLGYEAVQGYRESALFEDAGVE